jgi:6-phosphogluconolactonase (cycloisomerase 2 family)
MRMLIGSYGDEIATFTLDGQALRPSGPRVPAAAPSFLAAHPRLPIVYAVSELDQGAVAAFARDSLTALGSLETGGSQPCHVAVTPDGRHLACANYGSGSAAVFALAPDGTLDRRTELVRHSGSGPNPDRQEGPHCHEVVLTDDHADVVDLGIDQIVHYGLSDAGRLTPAGASRTPAGHGPRHFVTHPDGRRFVTDELSSTVTTYDARFEVVDSYAATLVEPSGDNLPSELLLSGNARFLYVANRGNNSITTFAVGSHGLTAVDEVATGGVWPRHMVIVEGTLLVAGERSNTVTALPLDDGRLGEARTVLEIEKPACILPIG